MFLKTEFSMFIGWGVCVPHKRGTESIKLRGEKDKRWSRVPEGQLVKSRLRDFDEPCMRGFPEVGWKEANTSDHTGKLGVGAGSLEC